MKAAVRMAEFVIFADVFTHVEEFADVDVGADLFEAFALQPLTQCLAMVLATAGQYRRTHPTDQRILMASNLPSKIMRALAAVRMGRIRW